MPFCPVCKYEYVEGVEKYSDCDVMLVDELPQEEKSVSQPVPEYMNGATIARNDDIVLIEESINCLRCNTALDCLGVKEFREATTLGLLSDEWLGDSMRLRLYVCRNCGHVEFFRPRE